MIYVLEAIFDMAGEWIVGNYLKLITAISRKRLAIPPIL